jgi:CRP-like cAMP-binding protein
MSVTSTNNHNPLENRILRSLPAEEYEQMLTHLQYVELGNGEMLSQPNETIEYVYFPLRGTISVVVMMEDGSEVEAGIIGHEGMTGISIALGASSMPLEMMVQLPDGGMRMKAETFREQLKSGGALHKLCLCFTQAFLIQTAQSVACNRVHKLDGRLAKWLLMCSDRVKSNDLKLTHEFIATMLGVRRSGVSVAASSLQANGLIGYTRGRIHILDKQGLEGLACECYGVVKREFDRLLA